MENSDKLVEYYFHRRIKGMAFSEIRQSLDKQFLEEGELDSILKQVEYREAIYLKKMVRQKTGRSLVFVALGLFVMAFILMAIGAARQLFSYQNHLVGVLMGLGIITGLFGLILRKP